MAGEKCCKLVLYVDKTIILNLAMMTVTLHFHLNTVFCDRFIHVEITVYILCQCDQYRTSLQHTFLILDIHVLIN